MDERKEIILTGDAAISNGGGKRRTRKKKGGGSGQAGTIVQLQSTASSSETQNNIISGTNPSKLASIAEPIKLNDQTAGAKPKIILKAAKKPINKVILSVCKTNHNKLSEIEPKNKSRKSSKKIMFSLKNLRKKLNKAKTIKKFSEEKSLNDIKKILEEAKLIKVGSKAPEAMIRQIYNDYMMLKHKAL